MNVIIVSSDSLYYGQHTDFSQTQKEQNREKDSGLILTNSFSNPRTNASLWSSMLVLCPVISHSTTLKETPLAVHTILPMQGLSSLGEK